MRAVLYKIATVLCFGFFFVYMTWASDQSSDYVLETLPATGSLHPGDFLAIRGLTEYALFKKEPDGSKRQIWRMQQKGKYVAHWTGTSGNTLIFDQLDGRGRMWMELLLVDRSGKVQQNWYSDDLSDRLTETCLKSAQFNEFKEGQAQELILPNVLGAGKDVTIDAIWQSRSGRPTVYFDGLPGPNRLAPIPSSSSHLLRDILKDERYACPYCEAINWGNDWAVWTARSRTPNVPDRSWIAQMNRDWEKYQDGRYTPGAQPYPVEHEIPGAPDALLKLDRGLTLWIEAPRGKDRTTTLRFLLGQGAQVLITKIKRKNLQLSDYCMCVDGNRPHWEPLPSLQGTDSAWPGHEGAIEVDVYDDSKTRHLFKFDYSGNGVETTSRGYASIRPEEELIRGGRVVSQKILRSPNGIFSYYRKQMTGLYTHRWFRLVLTAKIPGKGEVELWRDASKIDVEEEILLTDSGRLAGKFLQSVSGACIENGSLTMRDVDGSVIGGYNFMAPELLKPDEAPSNVLFNQLRVVSTGHATRVVKGLSIPVAENETYEVPIAGQTSQRFEVEKDSRGFGSLTLIHQ